MSGAFPSSPLPSSVSVKSLTPTLYDITQSGKRNVRQLGMQRWSIDCRFPETLSKEQAMPILAFLMAQEGRYETFTFISPDLATPRGTVAGSTPVVTTGSQVGKSVNTSGWANSTLVLKAGDVIKFAGHSKVYMVTSDVTSGGTGLATLTLSSPLITSPGAGESIVVENVPFNVQLTSDITEYNVTGPLLYSLSISMVEVL